MSAHLSICLLFFLCIVPSVTTMDVEDGTSADAPERWSWTGVGLIFMGKSIEKDAIGLRNWTKITYIL